MATETKSAEQAGRAPLRVKVARVVEETADARSFVLDVSDDTLRSELTYRAGQYVTVEIPWESFHIHRCYSFSSAPGVDAQPQFTVKRVAEGRMSNALIDRVAAGDTLTLHPPAGRFTLDRDAGMRPLSLFAGGSGVTPIFSLLKAALRETRRPVRMLYANRDAASTIFAAQLDALAQEHAGRFSLRHHHDDAGGFLTAETLADWLRGAPESGRGSDHYVCGPTPFMDAVEAALQSVSVDDGRVRVERFVSPADPDRRDTEPAQTPTSGTGEVPEDFLVTLGSSIRRVPYSRSLTLLGACKAAGVKAPSSCEDGFCGSCMCQLVEGDVAMLNPLALTDSDVARGRVLACQARPTSGKFLHVDFDAVSFRAGGDGDAMTPPLSASRAALVVSLCVGAALLVRWLHAVI
jgi:3-ketosteroid 9alpha-monooxygenase subunit B